MEIPDLYPNIDSPIYSPCNREYEVSYQPQAGYRYRCLSEGYPRSPFDGLEGKFTILYAYMMCQFI